MDPQEWLSKHCLGCPTSTIPKKFQKEDWYEEHIEIYSMKVIIRKLNIT